MAWCERRDGAVVVKKVDESAKGKFGRIEEVVKSES